MAAQVPARARRATTPAHLRNRLHQPGAANEAMGWGGELEAVDAVYAAYMAMNAAGASGIDGREHLATEDGPHSPMALLAKAAQAALARFDGVGTVGARKIWDAMVEGGSSARWCYDLWRRGDI